LRADVTPCFVLSKMPKMIQMPALQQLEAASIGKDDVVIGLAASGITPFTCAVLEQARKAGALDNRDCE
jgi:DNA-binding MurR/RpiR family transcriptional regulator